MSTEESSSAPPPPPFAQFLPPVAPPLHSPPTLVILYGYPGCGKLTTANTLAPMLPGFKVFHNHLVIDVLNKLFAFGTESFRKYREKLWLDLIPEAARNGDSIIFTYCAEWTMSTDFLDQLQKAFEVAGAEGLKKHNLEGQGKVLFINLDCDLDTVKQRLTNDSRKGFEKLTSVELFEMILSRGAFNVPQPTPDLVIDIAKSLPEETAATIRDFVLYP